MTDQPGGESPRHNPPDELERLKERVAFYESFDQLIHENIARSGDLLRQAMDLRETAGRELAEAKAEQERTDLTRYRTTLTSLLEEVTALQGHVERIGRQVADAIEEVEAALPPGERAPTPPKLPGSESISAPFLDTPPEYISFTTPEERAAAISSASPAEPVPDVEEPAETIAAQENKLDEASEPFLPDLDSLTVSDISGELSAKTDEAQAQQVEAQPPPAEPEVKTQSLTMLVHGVPRAATALSLQRYLAQLGKVETVEPREYAEGVLRLHVAVREPVSVEDLRGWKEGTGFEPVHTGLDLIEVRLPGASGF